MSLSEDTKKLAEDYLNGTISENDRKEFEDELKSNKELYDYISLNIEMRKVYSDDDWSFIKETTSETEELENYLLSDDALKAKSIVKKVNDQFVKTGASNKKKYYSYFAVAASIVVLIGYFIFSSPSTNLEIYEQNNDWSNLPSLASRSDSYNELLSKGEEAFFNEDYKLAENYFSSYLSTEQDYNATVLLYFGISNLELKNYDKALEVFNQLVAQETLDSSKGYWYKALTYLKMDDENSAIKELTTIAKNSSYYNYNQAKDLIKKLED